MDESSAYKHCSACKVLKPLTDFYPRKDRLSGYASWCKTCIHPTVEVQCSDCQITWMKAERSLKRWGGRCKTCTQKFIKNQPEVKTKLSQRAREQCLRQGGIPNAKKLTSALSNEYRKRRTYRKMTPDERRKFSLSCHRGDKHHYWRGGVTRKNQTLRSSLEYKLWREAVFARDDYTCQFCGIRGGRLNADHIKPFSEFIELAFDVSNGRTLCKPCHETTPTFGHRQHAHLRKKYLEGLSSN